MTQHDYSGLPHDDEGGEPRPLFEQLRERIRLGRISNLAARVLDLERELRELREELAAERVDRQNADESLERVLASRTEHLV